MSVSAPSLRRLAATLLLVCLATPAIAQRNLAVAPAAANEQRVALVIGNSAYKESPLTNPVNDAADMANALQTMGFKVIRRLNANTREMRAAIREFANELRRSHVGLFYFAGHGVQVKGNNYLVPVGADIESEADVEDRGIDANFVLRTMEEAQVKVSIAILDACRNNPFTRSFRSASGGLAQMSAATGSLVAFATAPGSVAADGAGRNGIYTKNLLASLKDSDTDILKVFQRTRAAVVKETGGKQTPWESTSLIGDFYFRPPTGSAQVASVAPVTQGQLVDPSANDRAFWDAMKGSKNPEEFKAYLDQYPRGLFAALAQARLKALQSTQVATVAPSAQTLVRPAPADDLQRLTTGTVFRDCTDCPQMVVIPPGRFRMGSPSSEEGRYDDEEPQHYVMLRSAFAVGKYEVTKAQFARFVQESGHSTDDGCRTLNGDKWEMDASKSWRNPGFSQSDNDPVVCVNWNDAKAYTQWLTKQTGKSYRLLTEAEWEYAARAGTTGPRYWGKNDNDSCRYANVADTSAKITYKFDNTFDCRDGFAATAPVGSFQPNAFGLHDMLGNVWEWTEDCKNEKYAGAPADGSVWIADYCFRRVLRGGSWNDFPRDVRSATREGLGPGTRNFINGFRAARTN